MYSHGYALALSMVPRGQGGHRADHLLAVNGSMCPLLSIFHSQTGSVLITSDICILHVYPTIGTNSNVLGPVN